LIIDDKMEFKDETVGSGTSRDKEKALFDSDRTGVYKLDQEIYTV